MGMGLANMLYEWDYTMCPRNGAVKSAEYGEAGRGEVNSVSFQIDSKTHKIQQNRTNQNEKTLHINNLATTKSIKTNKRAYKTNKSTIHKDVGGPRWGRAPT